MAKYEVNDISKLDTDSTFLGYNAHSLDDEVTSLNTLLNEVKDYWLQEEPDAIKYVEGLTNTIKDLKRMVTCFDKFSNSMNLYSNALRNTSSKSVN